MILRAYRQVKRHRAFQNVADFEKQITSTNKPKEHK